MGSEGNGPAPPAGACDRLCWIWPVRHRRATGRELAGLVEAVRPLVAPRRWPIAAAAAGLLPLALSYALGVGGHQAASALLTFPLLLACAREDRQTRAVALIGLVFVTHSALALGLTAVDPTRTAGILPGGLRYWDENLHWIRTGEDPEYVAAYWIPAHGLQLVGISLFSFTSLGLIPLVEGFYEVDLMNYYVGRLLLESRSGGLALVTGWHLWSVLRGVAYTILVYELASWSLERLSGLTLSTPRRRRLRWCVGLAFFLADGLVKFWTLDAVRLRLFQNLWL